MIEEYFDFEKFWKEEVLSDFEEGDIEDFEIELYDLTASEAITYLKNMPFPLNKDECQFDFEKKQIVFDFSKKYNESTESGFNESYISIFVVWSIEDEHILSIGYEQG
jgi:hypothetical protein